MDFFRSVPFELTRSSEDGLTLSGYAAVFGSPTRITGEVPSQFDEVIAPGAFARTINARDRIVMQYDHGRHPMIGPMPLGRIETLREDQMGLYVEARLTDNWLVSPVRDAIANGAIDGMSFRFSVPKGGDTWDRSGPIPLRTVNEVKLYELGPVTFPAYQDTSVMVRSALDLLRAMDEEDSEALALIQQIKPLVSQLASLEADAWAAGDDAIDELQAVMCVLNGLDYLETLTEGDDADMGMQMNSATPDEGSTETPEVTPDEGSQRTNRFAALMRVRDFKGQAA